MKKKVNYDLIITIVILIFAWQFGESLLNTKRIDDGLSSLELFLPTPLKIVAALKEHYVLLFTELFYTLLRGLLGLIIGTLFSLLLIIFFIFYPRLRNILIPISISLNSFPMVGFAPVIILLFGQGSFWGIVFVSALISYFPTLVMLDKAVETVNQDFLDLAEMWGGDKLDIFKHIQLPYLLPFLFTAVKLSLPASVIGATLGEWLGARHGIGQLITISLYQLNSGILYSSLILVALSVIILIKLIGLLQISLVPWKTQA